MPDEPSLKPVVEKLGVKPGQRWVLLGRELGIGSSECQERGALTSTRVPRAADGVVLRADVKRDLDRLTRLRPVIAPAGAIWVIWRKGQPALREDDVRAAALAQGLVDVKVIRVSDELSGLKLVIPVKDRVKSGK
jgi:hypothetical protein